MATLGGIREAGGSENSLEINDLARFAVDEHNKKQVFFSFFFPHFLPLFVDEFDCFCGF